MAEVLGALSNPHRLEIFLRLAGSCGPGATYEASEEPCACVGELAAGLGIAPSTVSHHLKELRRVGLIRTEKQGRRVECSIDYAVLDELLSFIGRRNGCCR